MLKNQKTLIICLLGVNTFRKKSYLSKMKNLR